MTVLIASIVLLGGGITPGQVMDALMKGPTEVIELTGVRPEIVKFYDGSNAFNFKFAETSFSKIIKSASIFAKKSELDGKWDLSKVYFYTIKKFPVAPPRELFKALGLSPKEFDMVTWVDESPKGYEKYVYKSYALHKHNSKTLWHVGGTVIGGSFKESDMNRDMTSDSVWLKPVVKNMKVIPY